LENHGQIILQALKQIRQLFNDFSQIKSVRISFAQNRRAMSTKKEMQDRRELAKMLFIHEQLSQKEISSRVSVSEVTISKWAKADSWESHRVSITITKEEQLKNLYRQLSEMNRAISEREGKKYATASEADAISKLAGAIEKMETDVGIADIVSVAKKFLSWMRKFDLVKAQEITPIFDAFIKDNLR
jgi:transcriptional regulator with XRE-family HTH domain